MTALIFGHDEAMAAWCARRIPHVGAAGFGPCRAIGIASSAEPDARMLAACVFHDYQPAFATCQISFAAASPRWASRETIRGLLAVPFDQYGCNKVWVAIPHDGKRALRFCLGIGMVREATLRHHFGPKRHAVICSMLDKEYRARWRT